MNKKLKIKVYLKSGNTIVFKCERFSATLNKDKTQYSELDVEGANKYLSFCPSVIEGWEVISPRKKEKT